MPLFSKHFCGFVLSGLGISLLLKVLLILYATIYWCVFEQLCNSPYSFSYVREFGHSSLLSWLSLFCLVLLICCTIVASKPLLLAICSIICSSWFLVSSFSLSVHTIDHMSDCSLFLFWGWHEVL
jgi:hypothetical protein